MPAGILTVSVRSFVVRPSPLHVTHGFEMMRPEPWQREHVRATVKNPCWKRCCPRPWHCGHVVGLVPGAAPEPLHVSHVSRRGISIDGLDAFRRFLERDFEVVAQIAAALGTAAASAAEKVAEDAAENILEAREGGRIEAGARLRRHARVAEPVVFRALLAVRQNRVGLGGLLESLLGRLCSPGSDPDDVRGRACDRRS